MDKQYCYRCGQDAPEFRRYCLRCNAYLPVDMPEQAWRHGRVASCKTCGHARPWLPSIQYCQRCGKNLTQASNDPSLVALRSLGYGMAVGTSILAWVIALGLWIAIGFVAVNIWGYVIAAICWLLFGWPFVKFVVTLITAPIRVLCAGLVSLGR